MVRYGDARPGSRPGDDRNTLLLETSWIIIPLAICLAIFTWGAKIYFAAARPPPDAKQFYVVGKQWMGRSNIPPADAKSTSFTSRGQAVKLKMTSEDVIHSFYIPAMR